MAQSTLLGWANSVRMTMTDDPGRELFLEQVQTHGFSFLDNYLSDILSGPKQDPLIELVKTPGRKKVISQKSRFPTKLAQVVKTPLEEPNRYNTQEDSHVVSDFTQALLDAKRGSEAVSFPEPNRTIVSPRKIPSNGAGSPNANQDHVSAPTHNQLELSVIAEDDEAVDTGGPPIREPADPSPSSDTRNQTLTEKVVEAQPSLPDETHSDRGKSTGSTSPATSSYAPPVIPIGSALNGHPSGLKDESTNANIVVPLRDVEVSQASPKSIAHKGVLPTLPTLPEPIPLRKSMRSARDLSLANVMLGAATPGNTGAGKRTSWLMKVREVAAMEGIPKKSTITPTPVVALSGVKRKSDETMDPSDQGDDERLWKAMKTKKEETIPAKIASPKLAVTEPVGSTEALERDDKDEMLNLLKKTVQSLEARTEKPRNKPFGNTTMALAEARAQAEARIAERHQNSAMRHIVSIATASEPEAQPIEKPSKKLEPSTDVSGVSDLFPSEGKVKDKSKSPPKNLSFHVNSQTSTLKSSDLREAGNHASASTTPPHSPLSQLSQTIPVFNKPSPVFVPPVPSSARPLPIPPSFPEVNFNFHPPPTFTKPPSMTLGISPRLYSPVANQITAPSTQPIVESVQSDDLFGERGNTEAWAPSTQDMESSNAFGTQQVVFSQQNGLDDDDSWPIDAKSSQGVRWPFSGFDKEDSMTWSTRPSQNYDSLLHSKGSGGHEKTQSHETRDIAPPPDDLVEEKDIEQKDYNSGVGQKPELDELIVSQAAPSEGSSSSTTMAPLESQTEFFGQASKIIGSIGKKGSGVKKIFQLASVIAPKQPQEDSKKIARLKEMENRRQIVMQRKAEEQRAKQQEQERKAKDEIERKKRERDEQGERKQPKSTATVVSLKKDEEITKKRKLDQDRSEKKQELKKQPSFNKSGFRPTASKQVNALSSSTAYNASLSQSLTSTSTSTLKLNEKPSKMPAVVPMKDTTKSSPKVPVDEEYVQPSQMIQTQMAARAKAAMQTEPLVPSENIELPEVNSEYSDSDDEGRTRTFDPPGWAQSPELRQALEAQSTINPDDIFGEIRPLRMEELFKAKASRFRPRSSSANWSGADRLTVEEEREYARRMGFK